MAEAVAAVVISGAVGAGLGEALSLLVTAITYINRKTSRFKTQLNEIQQTIINNKQSFDDIDKLLTKLNRPNEEKLAFITQLKGAEALVMKCEGIKWNFYKILTHESKLKKLNESLVRFCQTDVQLMIFRGVSDLQTRMMNYDTDSSGWLCGVPLPRGDVFGFDDHLIALKSMVLKDSMNDDCSVIVVSAGGGYGKTTLVKKLCNDPQIIERFGKNICFVTISETPNLKNVIEDLLAKKEDGQHLHFVNDEDAVNRWGSFLGKKKTDLILVLDDVWSEDIVNKFIFKLRGYNILVTSRTTFKGFKNIYQLELLNREDAIKLFRYSSLLEPGNAHTKIPNDLIEKLVDCCKNHPLTLTVVGGLLKGKNMLFWLDMLKKLSEEKQYVISINDQLFHCLKRSLNVFDENSVIKQCFLDLGLFPEDQKIAATTLMDMWVHLYKHDDEGLNTIKQLLELSYKNLVNMSPIRDDSSMVANWCEEKTVMQHDVMRQLAIHLSSQGPIEDRKRLIINLNEKELPKLPDAVNAQILSISTDERFSMNWNDLQASKVEVFVLNFMSEKYVLPRFMHYIEKLKVLIITNYGYYFSKLENFPPPQYLSSLTRLRLDHVSISSVSTTIVELVNLQKLSLIMCKIGNSFNEFTGEVPQKLPNLLEIDIESCNDLVTFPKMLCTLVRLRKISITNCHNLTSLSEEFGCLTNLEVLRLASCTDLKTLPDSIVKLKKLIIIDLSYCIQLSKLPKQMGELSFLKTIHMTACTGLDEISSTFDELCSLEVVCDDEISGLWNHHPNVSMQIIEKDTFGTFSKIVSK